MSRNRSMDGFVSRTPRAELEGGAVGKAKVRSLEAKARESADELNESSQIGINRSEIDTSLRDIDLSEQGPEGSRKKKSRSRASRKKIFKWIAIFILICLVAVGAYIGIKGLTALNKSLAGGGLLDFVQKAPLKQDANGRSNILVFGTSEDSEGGEHPGGNLTDSIMLVSIDQQKKDAFMISMPRDMWVKLDSACDVGYESKINSVYMCASNDGNDEAAGAKALQSKVGEVFGLEPQYYVHVNNSVVKDAVDAVGGITVKVESYDTINPEAGVYDPNFDWQCRHQCNMVKYKHGEVAHMDGDHALAFARARNAQGGYGLPNGNFDREKNQQKVMRALQDKAISVGTLTNVGKVTGLMSALGDNLRTNFEKKELRTVIELGQLIKGDKLQSINLTTEGESVVINDMIAGQSVVAPIKGTFVYSGIHAYINNKVNGSEVAKEGAKIVVLNGSGVAGAAQKETDKMEAEGMTIIQTDNAPTGEYGHGKLYQLGTGHLATKSLLQRMYGLSITTGDPPLVVDERADFVLIIGSSE